MKHLISSIENRSIPEMGTPVGGSGSVSSLSSPLGSEIVSSAEGSMMVEGGGGAEVAASPVAGSRGKAGHTGVMGFT